MIGTAGTMILMMAGLLLRWHYAWNASNCK
jgi:hypothetical protein